MPATTRRLARLLGGAALIGATGLAALPVVTPGATPTASAAASDACGAVLPKGDGTSWTCSFVDDFTSRGGLDPTKWIVQQTAATGFRTGETCYTASSKNIAVKGGELQLVARREPGRFTCSSPSGDFTTTYTGGMVGTRGKFSQAYGRWEVRAKFPATTVAGVHGGFWANPVKQTYGAWPASGEIDVAEWWSNDPTLTLPTLHYNGDDAVADSGWSCRVSTPSSYHTYAMEWYPNVIRFFVDGTACFERTWTPDSPLVAPQPFDQPFSMILNMGVGNASGVNAVASSTPLPATYTIDYAKVWR